MDPQLMIVIRQLYFGVVVGSCVAIWENQRNETYPQVVSILSHPVWKSWSSVVILLTSMWSFPLDDWVNYPIMSHPATHPLLPTWLPPPWLWPLLSVSQPGYCCQILPPKNLCQRNYFWLKFEPLYIFIFMKETHWKSFEKELPFHTTMLVYTYRQV